MTDELLTEEVLGYRVWRLTNGKLDSLNAPFPSVPYPKGRWLPYGGWQPGVVTATCRYWSHSPSPAPGCACGFWACHEPPRDRAPADHDIDQFGLHANARTVAYGAITAWGDIDVTSTDFRAQHARVVALAYLSVQVEHEPAIVEQVHRLAKVYGVACVNVRDLPMVAREHASEIPVALRGFGVLAPQGASSWSRWLSDRLGVCIMW